MKLPISIPHDAFKTLVMVVALLCGCTLGFMFTLALRGLPVPDEMGKFLLAVSTVLTALVMGPKAPGGGAGGQTNNEAPTAPHTDGEG